MQIKNDLNKILDIVPPSFREILQSHPDKDNLVEIVFDLGCIPIARFSKKSIFISDNVLTEEDLNYCLDFFSSFNQDNRSGIDKTLHRISCIRNRNNKIIGLTYRVGRAFFGTLNVIRDLIESDKSILFLGRPGVGKTTLIREISNILSSEIFKRVIIIDTSNEIAGHNDIPDPIVGKARRMQVKDTSLQHQVMVEAVENHTPEVIIVDEIGTELEAFAAQTIAERGVQLIATAHGDSLISLLKNPILSNLIGGLDYVTLGDEEAKRRNVKKTLIERKGLSTFTSVVELNTDLSWVIYENIELAVDNYLENFEYKFQIRCFKNNRKINFFFKTLTFNNFFLQNSNILDSSFLNLPSSILNIKKPKLFKISLKIYNYSFYIPLDLIKHYSDFFNYDLNFTSDICEAHFIIGLKSHLQNNKLIFEYSKTHFTPIYYLDATSYNLLHSFIFEIIQTI